MGLKLSYSPMDKAPHILFIYSSSHLSLAVSSIVSQTQTIGFVRMLVKTHSLTGIRLSQTFLFSRFLLARHSCSKLFLGGLSYDTNETVLKDAFEQHGEIIEAKVICHHVSGKSKGYGFVQFTSEIEATAALKEMDGQLLDGRTIRVHYAHKGRP